MPILDRIKSVWNAFANRPNEIAIDYGKNTGYVSYSTSPPSRPRLRINNEKSIVTSIYTRMSIDVSDLYFAHVQVDEIDRFKDTLDSRLNYCLLFEPNMDQGPRAFRQDLVMTLFDKGVAAIVPVDTNRDPDTQETVEILTMRVGEIVAWYPKHIRVSVYNEEKGIREEITLAKKFVAIVENPLYSVMNYPNSNLQRLIRKLGILDAVDEQSGSGKLDLIIQLPYAIKTEARREQAEKRRLDIEAQLKGSQYGIAYTDGTEKITQLNRPAENNLLEQIKYLTDLLYGQLGITDQVMNGTADEAAMINYRHRTIVPIADAIKEAMQRTFMGPSRIANQERVMYFDDPFKFATLAQLAEIADKFTRNEVVSSNELRGFLRIKPSTDPKADELRNSNMPRHDTQLPTGDQPVDANA